MEYSRKFGQVPTREELEKLRNEYIGKMIELEEMKDEYSTLKKGDKGRCLGVNSLVIVS